MERCQVCDKTLPDRAVIVKYQTPFTCPDCGQIEFPYQPLHNIVFIYPDPLPEKMGSFYFPAMYAENHRSKFGIVLAVGKGRYDKQFKWHPTTVRPGDRVVYDKDVPWHMMIEAPDGKGYHVKYMPELDIKGTVEEDDEGHNGSAGGSAEGQSAKESV